jgi:hypothetical protein
MPPHGSRHRPPLGSRSRHESLQSPTVGNGWTAEFHAASLSIDHLGALSQHGRSPRRNVANECDEGVQLLLQMSIRGATPQAPPAKPSFRARRPSLSCSMSASSKWANGRVRCGCVAAWPLDLRRLWPKHRESPRNGNGHVLQRSVERETASKLTVGRLHQWILRGYLRSCVSDVATGRTALVRSSMITSQRRAGAIELAET